MSIDDWKRLEAEAKKLSDTELVIEAKAAARAFVVLWREGDDRAYRSDFRLEVSILSDRVGIIVEGVRRNKIVTDDA